MAFDFLGTFTNEQLEELKNFFEDKLQELDNQSNHLIIESNRVRNLKVKYETALKNMGAPVNSNGVLISKRVERVRQSDSYKYINTVYEDQLFEVASLKKPTTAPALNDTSKSIIVAKLKQPFIPEIKFQRERLEQKIRKCGDLIEQMEEQRMIKLISRNEISTRLKLIKEILSAEDATKTYSDLSTY